jgi:hypothetical protein
MPPVEVFEKEFVYESDTGLFRHRYYKCGRATKYSVAGTITNKGYVMLRVNKTEAYQAHRVAWYMHYKKDPAGNLVDHVDRNKQNNAIVNLRLANDNLNQWNRKARGYHKRGNRYVASIRHNKHLIHLGTYGTPEQACGAYAQAALRLRGEYALEKWRKQG